MVFVTCVRLRTHFKKLRKLNLKNIYLFGLWKNATHTFSIYEKTLIIEFLCSFFTYGID